MGNKKFTMNETASKVATCHKSLTVADIRAAMDMLAAAGEVPGDPARQINGALYRRSLLNKVCRVVGIRNLGNELYEISTGDSVVVCNGKFLDRFDEELRKQMGASAPSDSFPNSSQIFRNAF